MEWYSILYIHWKWNNGYVLKEVEGEMINTEPHINPAIAI